MSHLVHDGDPTPTPSPPSFDLPPFLPPSLSPCLSSCQRGSPILYEFSVVKNSDAASGMQRERTVVLTKEFMAELAGSQVVALHR